MYSPLETELKLSLAITSAFKAAREAIAPVLKDAERYQLARDLYAFEDSYDGGDEQYPASYLPYAVAQGVAHYLVAGKLDNSQSWWDSWRADSHGGRTPQLAWLSQQLLDQAETFAPMRATFERAAVLLECQQCNGAGVLTAVGAHDSGENSLEDECGTCHGAGFGCGDCRPVDDPQVIR